MSRRIKEKKFQLHPHLCLNNTEKGTGLYQINAIGFPFIQEITVKIMFYNETAIIF